MLELYLIFFRIGMLSFGGGYVVLPLIETYIVANYDWVTSSTISDVIAISQVTPGPIAINAATFIGMINNGILGAIIASIGVITPQIILLSIFIKYIGFESEYVKKIMKGINPATCALILVATITIAKGSLLNKAGGFEYRAIICFVLTFVLTRYKINMIYIIVLSAIISLFI